VIKTLVSIEVDLASSLAIRFACQMGGFIDMEVNPVYVKGSPSHEVAMGAGWASRTWERETIEQGKEEIAQVIAAEMDVCPVLTQPRVVYGDRDTELLRIVQENTFDLFVEGVHFPWNPPDIFRRLHGRLYQKLPSPLVLVRSLRTVSSVLVLCTSVEGTRALSMTLERMWKNCPVPLELAYSSQQAEGDGHHGLRDAVHKAKESLEKAGCSISVKQAFPIDPEAAGIDALKQYGLVAIALEKDAKKENAMFRWLHLVQTSALVALYSKSAEAH
jgi:hypothetical protein